MGWVVICINGLLKVTFYLTRLSPDQACICRPRPGNQLYAASTRAMEHGLRNKSFKRSRIKMTSHINWVNFQRRRQRRHSSITPPWLGLGLGSRKKVTQAHQERVDKKCISSVENNPRYHPQDASIVAQLLSFPLKVNARCLSPPSELVERCKRLGSRKHHERMENEAVEKMCEIVQRLISIG